MLLAAPELRKFINEGNLDAFIENVNASSVDVTLGNEFQIERWTREQEPVDLSVKGASIALSTLRIIPEDGHYDLDPGEFVLAHTRETFNLPDTYSGLFILRSSMARNGLDHLQAGWADAGFHGAHLTLELKNETRYHKLRLRPGMRIGQMVFWKHSPAGDNSYAVKGSYNGQQGATRSNGGRG